MCATRPGHLDKINGCIASITFHNQENQFTILKVQLSDQRHDVTVVGHILHPSPGQHIKAQGHWIEDPKFGKQFKAEQITIQAPSTIEGIERFLGSGMIPGIGPHFAKRLVNAFGRDVFEIIENDPKKIAALPGIGKKRQEQLTSAWQQHASMRDLMVFLQSHGFGTQRANQIHRRYGNSAIEIITDNPYRLTQDIRGIGFNTADSLAKKLGYGDNHPGRIQAGILHCCNDYLTQGHCMMQTDALIAQAASLLCVNTGCVQAQLNDLVNVEKLVPVKGEALSLPQVSSAEKRIAEYLKRLNQGAMPWPKKKCQPPKGIELSTSQQLAIESLVSHKVSILTGGPGVGKTTLIKCLIEHLHPLGIKISLCAPTGRAAKRLQESTNMQAKTIHRLLKYDPASHAFQHDASYPLLTDLLILDESSMLDIWMADALLSALGKHAAVIWVGDIDQLPSIGPGSVLKDIIASQCINTVKLTEIHRQAHQSDIIKRAHAINRGDLIYPDIGTPQTQDFYYIQGKNAQDVFDKTITVISQRIPQKFGLDPITDIQCLTPMNKGSVGSNKLNAVLQASLNQQHGHGIVRHEQCFCIGDKVMQTVNNYDKDVYNGDMGIISLINTQDKSLTIRFDQREITYQHNELNDIMLAYAVSIHKSQGSEFPCVVIPLAMQHYTMLERHLLYTGITRGKKLVIVIAEKKAMMMAIKRQAATQRLTQLEQLLCH